MVDRPATVWLISWTLILANFYMLVKTMQQLRNDNFKAWLESFPFPLEAAEAWVFGSLAVLIVLGICIHEGKNWARYLFFGLFAINLALDFIHLGNPADLLHETRNFQINLAFFVVAIPCLFHPGANQFFCPPLYNRVS